MADFTRTEWVDYKDSTVLNIAYTIFWWKGGPGWVEVRSGDPEKVQKRTDKYVDDFVRVWFRYVNEGGHEAGENYLKKLGTLRQQAQDRINWTFQQAREINDEVLNKTNDAIRDLAKVKLAATVGVAVGGAVGAIVLTGGAALVVTGVSVGYSVTCSTIKNWEDGKVSDAVAVDLSKAAINEGVTRTGEYMYKTGAHNFHNASVGLKRAQKEMAQWSKKVATTAKNTRQAGRASSRLIRSGQRVAQETAKRNTARTVGAVGKGLKFGVPVLFAALDIWGAVDEYNETISKL
ncbi:MAG: hypothetical protein AAF439_04055 [Pseudomonadota bacterium]